MIHISHHKSEIFSHFHILNGETGILISHMCNLFVVFDGVKPCSHFSHFIWSNNRSDPKKFQMKNGIAWKVEVLPKGECSGLVVSYRFLFTDPQYLMTLIWYYKWCSMDMLKGTNGQLLLLPEFMCSRRRKYSNACRQ